MCVLTGLGVRLILVGSYRIYMGVVCVTAEKPGQYSHPSGMTRLFCWCWPFLEVTARHSWKDSRDRPLTWNICCDTPLSGGDPIKNSADAFRRRLLSISKVISIGQSSSVTCFLCPACFFFLLFRFSDKRGVGLYVYIYLIFLLCISFFICWRTTVSVFLQEILPFCAQSSLYCLTLGQHGSSASINNADSCCLENISTLS